MTRVEKILEKFRFKQYESFDVKNIKKMSLALTEDEWLKDTTRQDDYATHKETQTYFLYQTDLGWKLGSPYLYNKRSENQLLLDAVEPIVKYLEELHNGQRGQVLLIKLPGGKKIPRHYDAEDYLMNTRRHHVAIVTNKKTTFGVANETINIKQGECWEINNAKSHFVNNDSSIDRIHLLIDIMPNEFII
jgi:aspartyl/asparaginyl beta-hydroxylase (cupin superfamily)